MEDKDKRNTQVATERAMTNFRAYLSAKQLPEADDIPPKDIDGILHSYYSAIQPQLKDDENDAVQTTKCICTALNHYFRKNRGIDIVKDTDFVRSNEMFKAICIESKKSGKGVKKSYPPISPIDLERIAEYFCYDHITNPDPRRLQQNLVFYIIYFFCQCGRENLYAMKKNTFKLVVEPDGTEYICQEIDEIDKNHTADDTTISNEGKMYVTNGQYSCFINKSNKKQIYKTLKAKHTR